MNSRARKFEAKPAVRESVPLLVGIMGPSGSGKSFSGLRLATGIQQVTGGDVFAIDTEARRLLHYADQFKFKHVQFDPPHGSLDYLAAIEHCVKQGAKVIVVDSMSHEHSGVGGMIELQEAELDRLGGNDYAKRERVKMLAWQKPKANRRKLIDRILQINANFVFAFRARQTVKPMKVGGKTEIVPQGFMPIAGDEFLFEQTVNILLLPKSGGVPTWESENVGERMMIKSAKQFEGLFVDRRPLDEAHGKALAEWARGSNLQLDARPAGSAGGDASASPAAPAATPGMHQAGAAPVPTVVEYVSSWHRKVDAASKKSDAEDLARSWNAEKATRNKILWADDDTFPALQTKVRGAIEMLREHGKEAS